MDGFIKLHRSLLDSRIFANEKGLKIWVWLLLKANYKKRFVKIQTGKGFTEIEINRGEMIFGRFKAEEELNIDGSTVYKWLQKMQDEDMIKIQSNTHCSVITICKYDEYNNLEDIDVTSNEQPSSNQVATNEQPSNTPKKDNKDNKEKKVFIKPTFDELNNFIKENGMNIDAEYFINHYESNGWLVGKSKMKDWKATVRNWHKRNLDKITASEPLKERRVKYLNTGDGREYTCEEKYYNVRKAQDVKKFIQFIEYV